MSDPLFEKVVEMCNGLDGRRIRKLVAAACARNKETALTHILKFAGVGPNSARIDSRRRDAAVDAWARSAE